MVHGAKTIDKRLNSRNGVPHHGADIPEMRIGGNHHLRQLLELHQAFQRPVREHAAITDMNHADQTFCQLLDKTVNLGIGCVKVRKLDHDRGDVSFRGAVDDALDVIDRAPAAQLEQGGKLTRNQ